MILVNPNAKLRNYFDILTVERDDPIAIEVTSFDSAKSRRANDYVNLPRAYIMATQSYRTTIASEATQSDAKLLRTYT